MPLPSEQSFVSPSDLYIDDCLQMIEQLHTKLQDRMMLNRRDPFTVLPLEIATMVIQEFSFKQIV